MRSTGMSVILAYPCFILSTLATSISVSKTPILPLDVQSTSHRQWWPRKVDTLTRLHSLHLLEREILKKWNFLENMEKGRQRDKVSCKNYSASKKTALIGYYQVLSWFCWSVVMQYWINCLNTLITTFVSPPASHLCWLSFFPGLNLEYWCFTEFCLLVSSLLILQILKLYLIDLSYLLLLLL